MTATTHVRSSATADRAIQVLTRIIGNHPDDHVCLVEAGALRIALREMGDHEEDCAELEKEHEAEMVVIEQAARDLIAAVEEMNLENVDTADVARIDDAIDTLNGLF